MNYYQRHVGDIARATFGLSLAEFGAYDRLLDFYYSEEKALPLMRSEVYRIAAASSRADRSAVDYVLAKFFTEQPDGWHQKRCDEEIEAYRVKAETARHNGKSGGRPRNQEKTQSVISGNPEEPTSKANQEPVTSNQEPAKERASPNGSRLPSPWELPEEWAAFARAERPGLDVARVAVDFRDYWHSTAGSRGRKADWFATWRAWVRRENAAKPQSQADKLSATAEAMYGNLVREMRGNPTDISGTAKRLD